MLSCLYISVEAHAYGYRPQPQPVRPAAYGVKQPSSYSYVRPAAGGYAPQQPAVKYAAPAKFPAVKYAVPVAKYAAAPVPPTTTTIPPATTIPPTTVPPVAISNAAYKSGDNADKTLLYATTSSTYNADAVYYTTEPTYYTTTPYSYYAETIYYSTQQPAVDYGTTASYSATEYSYVDPGTYFAEDVTGYYTDSSLYTTPANYAPAAVPVDYVTAAPAAADFAPAVPVDYADAARAHYLEAGFNTEATPAYYAYTDPTAYYSVAPGAEQYAPAPNYYTDSSTAVYDGQQSYIVGGDAASYASTDVPVYSNDYTTAVPVYYYTNDQAAPTATISPFYPAQVQYTA
jgi:hypothetical protein